MPVDVGRTVRCERKIVALRWRRHFIESKDLYVSTVSWSKSRRRARKAREREYTRFESKLTITQISDNSGNEILRGTRRKQTMQDLKSTIDRRKRAKIWPPMSESTTCAAGTGGILLQRFHFHFYPISELQRIDLGLKIYYD